MGPVTDRGHSLFAVTSRWRSVNATWELWFCFLMQNCLSSLWVFVKKGLCLVSACTELSQTGILYACQFFFFFFFCINLLLN